MLRKLSVLILTIVALGAFAFAPATAQTGLTWNMQIYPNGILAGNPIVTQQVSQVAFDWGAGTPANGVGADNFSIRFATDPYFTAGTYRFYAWADDEVNVNVGYAFQPQVDTFNKNQVGQVVYADVPLTEGVHHVQVNYREGAGNAYVYVTWVNITNNPNPPGPNFPAPQNSFSNLNNGGTWWAQYFNNRDLSGTPVLQQSEPSVNHDWGTGAPGSGVNADNFSVRWNAFLTLDAGLYQISVNADDGARVYVDGQRIIDQWHDAANTTYTTAVNLAAGSHTFVVEYYEAAGAAFIHYTLSLGGVAVGTGPQQGTGQQQSTGVIATVTAARLNVRSAPGLGNRVVVKINQGETYAVLGSNADKSWYQINVNGTVGWVSAQFVTVSQGSVPVAGSNPTVSQPAATGLNALVLATLNLRDKPNQRGTSLAKIPFNTTVQVIGRNAANSWWQVRYQNLTGWVSSRYARLQQGTIRDLPITG